MKPNFLDVSTEWTESVFGADKLPIRVLVVADGFLTFFPGDGFSLKIFCDILRNSALPWETIMLTAAHRTPGDPSADISGFKFDMVKNGTPVFSIDTFDVVWLFGYEGETGNLDDSEIDAITTFMNKGGGVFATGDHEDLGCAMCGKVPRVRRMRRWHFNNVPANEIRAPEKNGSTRLDTLREGINPGFQGDEEEEDNVPQEIRPKFFINGSLTASEPHPLLVRGDRTITILPDHMHEGECVPIGEIQKAAATDPVVESEFPPASSGAPVWPQVVAISTSAGGAFFVKTGVVPVEPRCYIIIEAYDGHLVQVKDAQGVTTRLGRVVVDASFHHFVEDNLKGYIVQGQPNEDGKSFVQYYRNILSYLLPPDKQITHFLHLLTALRFSQPLVEEIQGLSPANWKDVLFAGHITQRAIANYFSPAHARMGTLAMLSSVESKLSAPLQEIINLWNPREDSEDNFFFLNSEPILIAVLGSVMLGLATPLPPTHHGVSAVMAELAPEGHTFRTLGATGLENGLGHLQQRIGDVVQQLSNIP